MRPRRAPLRLPLCEGPAEAERSPRPETPGVALRLRGVLRLSGARIRRSPLKALLLLLLLSPWMVPALLSSALRRLSALRMAAAQPPPSDSLSAAFVTCPTREVATQIARALVERRMAACVNLVPQITSIYEWRGKIEEDSEVLLMIKTRTSRVPALAEYVRSVHPYEVAEVIALPIQEGNPPYLQWVREMVPE